MRSIGARARSHAALAALFLAGIALALLAAEGLVRMLDVPPNPLAPLHVPSYRLLEHPVLRYGYAPNLRADHAAYDPMHRGLSTNADGFRDRPFVLPKPPGMLRIIALGDSTTAGLGIPELANTWPKFLERRIRQATLRRVEVLNLGVGGYDPHQEAELLRTYGLGLEPDLVLVLLCTNDLRRGADGGVYEALLRARAHLDAPEPSLVDRVERHSRLAFVVRHRWRALAGDEAPRTSRARWQGAAESPLDEGVAILEGIAEAHDLPVLLFLLPALDGPADAYRHHALHREMAARARRHGNLPWIDLLDDLASVAPNLRQLSLDGLHPNRVGSAAIAEMIFRELLGRRVLAGAGATEEGAPGS